MSFQVKINELLSIPYVAEADVLTSKHILTDMIQ